jgi:hypothetical protein
MIAVAKKKRNKLPNGRVIKFKSIESFLRNNGGARAVAYQDGGTYAILAKNGNCTPLFNSDWPSISHFLHGSNPVFIPIREG